MPKEKKMEKLIYTREKKQKTIEAKMGGKKQNLRKFCQKSLTLIHKNISANLSCLTLTKPVKSRYFMG